MTGMITLEILGVVVCWAVVAFTIWKWGPGLRKRSVTCPGLKISAQVMADQREAEFGCLRVADIKACSVFPDGDLACGKECLARL